MKKWITLFFVIILGLSACSGPAEPSAETPGLPEQAVPGVPALDTAAPQDILGKWTLNPEWSTGGGSSMLDPLEGEIFDAAGIEITSKYLLFGDFGHTYSWIDDQRIRIDGVGISFSSVNEGFFYVLTVQRDGDTLRFLTADGAPFVVFSVPGSLTIAPESDVAVSAEETAILPMQPVAPTPWTPCEGGYETHLFKGGYAYVNPVPPEPNIVRSAPDANSPQTGLVQPNELMEITEGPQCAGGWVWWQITSKKTGLSGWTAEGDGTSYWVLPCPVGGSECGAP